MTRRQIYRYTFGVLYSLPKQIEFVIMYESISYFYRQARRFLRIKSHRYIEKQVFLLQIFSRIWSTVIGYNNLLSAKAEVYEIIVTNTKEEKFDLHDSYTVYINFK
jgi:hypothetical protein